MVEQGTHKPLVGSSNLPLATFCFKAQCSQQKGKRAIITGFGIRFWLRHHSHSIYYNPHSSLTYRSSGGIVPAQTMH